MLLALLSASDTAACLSAIERLAWAFVCATNMAACACAAAAAPAADAWMPAACTCAPACVPATACAVELLLAAIASAERMALSCAVSVVSDCS